MRHVRIVSQGLFLLFFLFLLIQTESKGNDDLGYPVRLFLEFDPLIFITTLLSAHWVAKAFYLSLIVTAATALLGRVFCGWVCPLGTLNNIIGLIGVWKRSKKETSLNRPGLFRLKYHILIFLLFSSLFTLQLVGIMDPLSLLIRSFSIGVYPAFNYGARAFFDTIYGTNTPVLTAVSETVNSLLKRSVLSFQQPYYAQAVFTGIFFLFVLGLNLVERRFWCKYLCPLGAFFGLISRYALLGRSVGEGCNSCGACAKECQGGAAPDQKDEWKGTECLYCMNCDDACPRNAVSFGFGVKGHRTGMDLGRRRLITSALSGMAAVPLVRSSVFAKDTYHNPELIRPPGSLAEAEFLKRCVKCGECMKVCITNGLQPALWESGLEGLWSPVLVSKIGHCEYNCTLCGQVCPTGAIKRLTKPEKARTRIGLAMIDKSRCLPYAHARPCIVCEEMCPTPKKAIWFETASVKDRNGMVVEVKQPRIDLELCIGCGICEAKCPVADRAAVRVTSVGESRSSGNQVLLY